MPLARWQEKAASLARGAKAAYTLRFALRRRGLSQGIQDSRANETRKERTKSYSDSAAEDFQASKVRIISIASDASRVNGKDVMVSALYAPEIDLACWGDPMAG